MKQIPLTQGKFAIVDDADFEWLNQYKWCLSYWGYAVSRTSKKLGKQKTIFMHRLILGVPKGMDTDHVNGNRLDNRRANIRACSRTQNNRNKPVQKNNLTKFKGVCFRPEKNRWRALIMANRKRVELGLFKTAEEAHAAYCAAAKKYHGEYARFA